MKRRLKVVTREDVARKAGVSVSAVSRTMNGRGYVAKDKKEAILTAVNELGYRPNPLSNSLKNKQTYQLCFFNVDNYNSFYSEFFDYMSNYAEKRGYTMFLFTKFNLDRIRSMLMDGMIVGSEAIALETQEILGDNFYLPIVSASFGIPIIRTKKIPYVDIDTYDAMERGIQYLMKKGHKIIAYGTPYDNKNEKTIQSRNVAFENIMKPILEHPNESHYCKERKFEDYLIISKFPNREKDKFAGEFFFEEGMCGADLFYEKNCDATAIICFNDEYAMGMMSRLKLLGYRIPEDVSVMGIDGIQNRKYSQPLLTSVALNIEAQAKACVDILLDMVEGRKINYFTSIKSFLKEGESVKSIQ